MAARTTGGSPAIRTPELAPIAELHAHPQNYRAHPDDQRRHLVASMREHGLYRNVIVARDGTILAGHGVVEAAREAGLDSIPVVRLDVAPDDPSALRVLTGDNEVARLAAIDDRVLADLLREIRDTSVDGLLGTGYDDAMLASLVFITRPEGEIATLDHAAEWVGMPTFEKFATPYRVVVSFETAEDRERFLDEVGVEVINRKDRETWSVRWPPRPKEDLSSLFFDPAAEATG